MTRVTGPDCAVTFTLIDIHTHNPYLIHDSFPVQLHRTQPRVRVSVPDEIDAYLISEVVNVSDPSATVRTRHQRVLIRTPDVCVFVRFRA